MKWLNAVLLLAVGGALASTVSAAEPLASAARPAAGAAFAPPDCAGAPRHARRNGNLLVRRPHGLDLVTPSGRLVKRVTHTGSGQLDGDASVSPDGKKVVFTRAKDKGQIENGTKLMTVDLRSGRTRVIHTVPKLPGYDGWTAWSPDGRHIAFRSQYQVGRKQRSVIQVIRPDGRGLTDVGLAEPHDAEVFPDRMLDWSANGRCLAWYTYVPEYSQDGIVLVDARGTAPHAGGPLYPKGFEDGWPTYATFANNGASLLVADLNDKPGNRFVIRALSLRRPGQRVLADDVGVGSALVSSPDGRQLAYTDYRGRTVARRLLGRGTRVHFRDRLTDLEDWAPR
jgi:dipeptidyl aminopeptidase/acylaminoacyl peptidase